MTKRSQEVRRYRELHRLQGLCESCPRTAAEGSRLCLIHKERARLRELVYRLKMNPNLKRRVTKEYLWYMMHREQLEIHDIPSTPPD